MFLMLYSIKIVKIWQKEKSCSNHGMPFLQFEYKNYFSILMIYTYRRQSNCHFGKLLQIKSKKEAFFFFFTPTLEVCHCHEFGVIFFPGVSSSFIFLHLHCVMAVLINSTLENQANLVCIVTFRTYFCDFSGIPSYRHKQTKLEL